MNQLIDADALVAAVPIPVTRADRLREWAKIVRACNRNVWLLSNLEHLTEPHISMPLDAIYGANAVAGSPFGLAANHPPFRVQGYTGSTLRDAMSFFEVNQSQLHEFSCDCGGMLSNEEMARRIERLA